MAKFYFRRVAFIGFLACLLLEVSGHAEPPRRPSGKSSGDIGNADAADIVSRKHENLQAKPVRVEGATVYPPPEPVHPLAELGQAVPPAPPQLPSIKLESETSAPLVTIPARQRINDYGQFRKALDQLKETHKPFLRDLTPPAPKTRVRMDLHEFDFRYETTEDEKDITIALAGRGQWEKVRIPHYVGPVGKWAGFYRTELTVSEECGRKPTHILHFDGVDYSCQVYLNGRCVGTHTGYFGAFEIDVTDYLLRDQPNTLVVRVQNDFRTRVYGGEKIFASAPVGFDDPKNGWNHTGSGAGLWQKCYLEGRPKISVTEIYVIPDVTNGVADVRVVVDNVNEKTAVPIDLSLSLYPKNFEGKPIENIPVAAEPIGSESSEYRALIKLDEFRTWTPEHPWLYTIRAKVQPRPGTTEVFEPVPGRATINSQMTGQADCFDAHFGMRTFTMDTSSEPKGRLYLNGEPVILRGSQPLSHLLKDVMDGNDEQLIEDILIYKLTHLNYIRLCQSPHPWQAYDMFDRLGILVQTDMPQFGEIRRPLVEESIKQAGEMERLVRSHPSCIMVSLLNEPANLYDRKLGHRHLLRPELHRYFDAVTSVIHTLNPSRVVKPIDGDYQPPSPGFPDDHIYCMWYLDHGVPIGRLIRGYWKNNKAGWYHGCGEWGISALDDAQTLFERYPQKWLPKGKTLDEPWNPKQMGEASQIPTRSAAWHDKVDTLGEAISVSQAHQAQGIDWMQRAFRRQSDRLISTAQFLLIDGWPANCWGFSLIDVARRPKPAYYFFREACSPLLADIRTDRFHYYAGQPIATEFWLCNDKAAPFAKGNLIWEVWMDGQRLFAQSKETTVPAYGPAFQGYFNYKTPVVEQRKTFTVKLALVNSDGSNLTDYALNLEAFPKPDRGRNTNVTAAIVGKPGSSAWQLAGQLGLKASAYRPEMSPHLIMVDDVESFEMAKDAILEYAKAGGSVLFCRQPPGKVWELGGIKTRVVRMAGKYFVSRKSGHPIVARNGARDFAYWYDPGKDYIDHLATSYLEGDNLIPILLSGDYTKAARSSFKGDLAVDAEVKVGSGSLIFSQLDGSKTINYEPVAFAYYQGIIDYSIVGRRSKVNGHASPR